MESARFGSENVPDSYVQTARYYKPYSLRHAILANTLKITHSLLRTNISGMILEKKNTFPGKKIHVPWKKYLQPLEKKFRLLWPCGPLCGPLVLWSCGPGPVVLWSSGPVVLVLWSCGPLAKAWKEICTDQKSLEGVQKEVKKKKKWDN